MAEIREVVSESLQATIRRLLPSQKGFTEDLQASNVITPIIDLTPTAEGSVVRSDLQTALAFGSQTSFVASGSTVVLANQAGFWRVTGVSNMEQAAGTNQSNKITISDGLSTKTLWEDYLNLGSGDSATTTTFDYTFFLRTGDSISVVSSAANNQINGSYRQIATSTGELINPSGFNPQ